jgi:hypothetical protein
MVSGTDWKPQGVFGSTCHSKQVLKLRVLQLILQLLLQSHLFKPQWVLMDGIWHDQNLSPYDRYTCWRFKFKLRACAMGVMFGCHVSVLIRYVFQAASHVTGYHIRHSEYTRCHSIYQCQRNKSGERPIYYTYHNQLQYQVTNIFRTTSPCLILVIPLVWCL